MGSVDRLNWEEEKVVSFSDDEDYKIVYKALNSDGDEVGRLTLQKVGDSFDWCWNQRTRYYMSSDCIEEVRMKQKELFDDRKGVE